MPWSVVNEAALALVLGAVDSMLNFIVQIIAIPFDNKTAKLTKFGHTGKVGRTAVSVLTLNGKILLYPEV